MQAARLRTEPPASDSLQLLHLRLRVARGDGDGLRTAGGERGLHRQPLAAHLPRPHVHPTAYIGSGRWACATLSTVRPVVCASGCIQQSVQDWMLRARCAATSMSSQCEVGTLEPGQQT